MVFCPILQPGLVLEIEKNAKLRYLETAAEHSTLKTLVLNQAMALSQETVIINDVRDIPHTHLPVTNDLSKRNKSPFQPSAETCIPIGSMHSIFT